MIPCLPASRTGGRKAGATVKPDNCQRFVWPLRSISPHPISKFRGGVSTGGQSASLTGAPGLPAVLPPPPARRGDLCATTGVWAGLAVVPGPGLSPGGCFAGPSQGLREPRPAEDGGALLAQSRRPGPAPPRPLPPSAQRPSLPPSIRPATPRPLPPSARREGPFTDGGRPPAAGCELS